ncbi:Putative Acetate--CoA ligase [Rhizopus microsporus]|nr:Putative Acetate--CoA ligase [Rhizopus microsporus]
MTVNEANTRMSEEKTYPVPSRLLNDKQLPKPFISSFEEYQKMWEESVNNPSAFFGNLAKELLHWSKPFETVQSGSLKEGDVAWFLEGELNASFNCVDRHALATPDKDIYACMADIGWITGHTYLVYGPLSVGATSLLFESTPTYPTPSRFWETVEKHRVTQFYTAPTAIRALRRLGDEWVDKCDLSSLRVIGSVGEPINPEAWEWYYDKVGKRQCAVVDTYWQTETGSIIITPLPGATATKPGSATFPFFGIKPVILDPTSGKELEGNDVTGVLAISQPWPSMARSVYNNHNRYLDTYLYPYKGYYFTGDGATRDKDGFIWIRGRVDDVINVSGHRLSTAEIESALILHHSVAEAAVVGGHDDLTGQCIHAFATLKPNIEDSEGLEKELALQVRKVIGPFATPKRIYVISDLPKTRSGKIMRRILRKIVNGEHDSLGDISTLADPSVVEQLIKHVHGKK